MNSAYNFNLLKKATFSGSLEWPLYTGLTVLGQIETAFTVLLPRWTSLECVSLVSIQYSTWLPHSYEK